MSNLIFTPGQKEEAYQWYAQNCPDALALTKDDMSLILVDIYFKLKHIPFSFKPEEFVVGIEYKDAKAVADGKEVVNVRINNPHKKMADQITYDEFALAVLYNLFKGAQI